MLRHINMLFSRVAMVAAACACLAACGTSAASSTNAGTPLPDHGSCTGANSGPGGFAVSLVRNTGGEPTPVEAAQTFIRTGGIWSSPQNGWRVTSEDQSGATLVAQASSLHAIRLADATWAVDSGSRCSG